MGRGPSLVRRLGEAISLNYGVTVFLGDATESHSRNLRDVLELKDKATLLDLRCMGGTNDAEDIKRLRQMDASSGGQKFRGQIRGKKSCGNTLTADSSPVFRSTLHEDRSK